MPLGIRNNVSALNTQRSLFGANKQASSALAKLSSGFRINQAKDGPAALIISELLRSQLGGLNQAVRNTQEASNVLSIAEGGLSQIGNQLRDLRALALSSLNSGITSKSQTSANQSALDSSLSTITRVAGTTRFSNQNLLNGAQDFTFSTNDSANLIDTGATSVSQAAASSGLSVNVQFSGDPADQAEKATLETSFGGGTALTAAQEFTITGEGGSKTFSFNAGTDITAVVDTINNSSESTGVTAFSINGDSEIRLTSNEFGAAESVRVEQATGDAFAATGSSAQDSGQNATLTVNGQRVETDGLTLNVSSSEFTGTINFSEGDPANTTIAQTGYDQDTLTDSATSENATLSNFQGGLQLQLGGGSSSQNRDTFGLRSVDPSNLGRTTINGQTFSLSDLRSGGAASLARDPAAALQVIDQAINDIASERGRIGAYQANTLESNVNSLSVAIENVTATESGIRDTDMAKQIGELIKAQLLEKVGLMAIQSANVSAQGVLKLLGGS